MLSHAVTLQAWQMERDTTPPSSMGQKWGSGWFMLSSPCCSFLLAAGPISTPVSPFQKRLLIAVVAITVCNAVSWWHQVLGR